MKKRNIGRLGENIAADYLRDCGYQILAMNYTAKCGEIDIIAKHEDLIVFVEVKTRKNSLYGTAAQAVDYRKQKKIIRTAYLYITLQQYDVSYRFDVIEIYYNFFGQYKLNHIEGAFEV
ncbi:YraN family protein [Pectinatus cerevisiiphilus]|uniref:UPF0102 protein EDC37_107119 n=1 Tax=Pectinatus cerevisiiphilus TaxID=86956 RepID=A0A4V6NYW3_9FIRM|nr:YraN family protein [Pectinatus cerevisiiphilus]TCS79352.1 putative endonuclease [Pectinatus cerevisiiphilus]